MSYYRDKGERYTVYLTTYQGKESDLTAQKVLDTFGYVYCPKKVKSLVDITKHAIFVDIAEGKENSVILQTYQRYSYMENKVQKDLSNEYFENFYRPCSEVKE